MAWIRSIREDWIGSSRTGQCRFPLMLNDTAITTSPAAAHHSSGAHTKAPTQPAVPRMIPTTYNTAEITWTREPWASCGQGVAADAFLSGCPGLRPVAGPPEITGSGVAA